jgi:DNA recombination protein RmuC
MLEPLLLFVAVLLVGAVVALVILVARVPRRDALLRLEGQLTTLKDGADRVERVLREEIARVRDESSAVGKQTREELGTNLLAFGDSLGGRVAEIGTLQQNQLEGFARQIAMLTQSNDQKLDRMRETVEGRLQVLQEDNSRKLEKMRETVDEKLHATLEQRLGESFRQVSERLEQVHKGLGEMQTLASGVGDLKKVLTNIKTRGMFGEVQLGNLLEQVMAREQYATNVITKTGSNDRVEFAIRLPGRDGDGSSPVWLPIDAKFPQEDYQRLLEAQEQANPQAVDDASRLLEARLKNEAKAIREKYLDPPHTTDFGIMFLPTEGLFAEAIRRAGLTETLQREFHVLITGPTTLLAVLNSLQMGFRTLVIEKRTSEVWSLLGAVKAEFSRFGEALDRTQKKLQEASSSIETAATRSRAIEKKLKGVQELPTHQAPGLPGPSDDGEKSL